MMLELWLKATVSALLLGIAAGSEMNLAISALLVGGLIVSPYGQLIGKNVDDASTIAVPSIMLVLLISAALSSSNVVNYDPPSLNMSTAIAFGLAAGLVGKYVPVVFALPLVSLASFGVRAGKAIHTPCDDFTPMMKDLLNFLLSSGIAYLLIFVNK